MDSIDRQAAIDVFEDTTFTKNEIRRRLSELPPAQPEIIRCEECMYRNNTGASTHWLPCMEVATGDYWFCGSGKRAERREE